LEGREEPHTKTAERKSRYVQLTSSFAAHTTAIVLVLIIMVVGPSTASAVRPDRTPPTMPGNFRVTGTTAYTALLAWNPSTDNSGNFSYVLSASGGPGQHNDVSLPQTATSFTWDSGVLAGYSYTFSIYAVDAAGNRSTIAQATTTLPGDTTPPGASVLSVTGIGSTHVSLSWTPAQEDGPYVTYSVYINGNATTFGGPDTSATITGLEPETTYTFAVRARDNWQNWSPFSNLVTVTTEPADPNDTTPPTTPANLTNNGMTFEDGETWLFWEQSTDNVTPQSLIQYEVYANGVLDRTLVGRGETVLYGTVGMINTFQVIAVDEASNRSAPATFTIDMR
jgi:chitodextrinase